MDRVDLLESYLPEDTTDGLAFNKLAKMFLP